MIRSMFYARFHTAEGSRGPKILHEVPEGSITPSDSPSALRQPLFDPSLVMQFIIPHQDFCDHLITAAIDGYRIIGYPVCISDYSGKYARNEFIFNLAIVIDEDVLDWAPYASIIRKLGRLLRALEEQDGFLTKDEAGAASSGHRSATTGHASETSASARNPVVAHSKMYALCEMILEDLNNYRECMIPFDDANTVNLKLFPTLHVPAPVHAWHVPLMTIKLSSFSEQPITSDLTLQRVLPYIDGVRTVSHIAILADTDLKLTKIAIRHLVYYNCVLLLDIFQFAAIYAPTPRIHEFVTSEALQQECKRYVTMPRTQPGIEPADIDPMNLVLLYTSLRRGVTLKDWMFEDTTFERLACIDIRRLITFGVIKGFLYRVHKYVLASTSTTPSPAKAGPPVPPSGLPGGQTWAEDGAAGAAGAAAGAEGGAARDISLAKYMDGIHCFDEIMTELQMSDRVVMDKMKETADCVVIHK